MDASSNGMKRQDQENLMEHPMKKLVVVVALGTILAAPAFARQSHRDVRGSQQEQYQEQSLPASAKCMIDEGNGRYTPCDALYKSKKVLP
jgi:hypothetical protein